MKDLYSRIAGVVVGSLVAYLAGKGITVDQETTQALVTVMIFVFGLVYAVVHRLVDRKLNPKDVTATGTTTRKS